MKITTVSVCVIYAAYFAHDIASITPDTWTVLFVWHVCFASYPHHYARYAALTLLFSCGGYLPPGRPFGRETSCPPTQRRQSLLPPIKYDHSYGRITHCVESRSFLLWDCPAWPVLTHGSVCRTAWAMTLKVREAVHGQLNEGGFDGQRYALAQHQPLTGRFLQAKND